MHSSISFTLVGSLVVLFYILHLSFSFFLFQLKLLKMSLIISTLRLGISFKQGFYCCNMSFFLIIIQGIGAIFSIL